MKAKGFLVLSIFAITAVPAFAQTKTITNFDLEKYRQQRLQAEKDLNENYRELGFPSPEERERRLEAWKKESKELAERLRRERLEQENADALARQAAAQQQYYQPTQPDYPLYDNGVIYSYGAGFGNRFRRIRPQFPQGYFAGGAFWPAPSLIRIPILIRQPRPRPRH